jgi:hypothetical protein
MKLLGRYRTTDRDPNTIGQRNLDASCACWRCERRGAGLCRGLLCFAAHVHGQQFHSSRAPTLTPAQNALLLLQAPCEDLIRVHPVTARHLGHRGARHARFRDNPDFLFDSAKMARGDPPTERIDCGYYGGCVHFALRSFVDT